MQNIKGAIRIFAILMALSCLFYLSFTFVTRHWENKAEAYVKSYMEQQSVTDYINQRANGNTRVAGDVRDSIEAERKHFFLYDSLAGKKIYLGLYTYESSKDKELSLGLDLQGGMNVTMEVSTPDIVRALANYSEAPDFTQAMEKAQKAQENSTEDFITLFVRSYREVNPNGRLASIFAAQLKDEKITFNSPDDQVEAALRKEADDAVERAKLVIETRINEFGVAQPNIQHLKSTNRIMVELPGVKDEERVSKILESSANLEFWQTYDFREVAQQMSEVNERLKIVLGFKDSVPFYDTLYRADYSAAKTKADSVKADSVAKIVLDSARMAHDSLIAMDTTGKAQEKNPIFDYAVMQNQDPEGKGPTTIGVLVKDTAAVMNMFRRPEVAGILPADCKLAWTAKPEYLDNGKPFLMLLALRESNKGGPVLEGDVVTDARKTFNQMSGSASPEISMSMNAQGTKDWARITKDNIGRSIAIVLDDNVYSFPTVNGEITGGQSQITGRFDNEEADDLVKLLNTGKLPAKCNIVEKTVVGAELGQDAVRAGLLSFIVALIVVLVYMAFYYSKAGLVADFALFVNVFFILGILSSLGAVLTLPGIAGVVLTIALSVDANILIFERIREELREGKNLSNAIADGYKHAMSSILDSNLSTLILGIILYAFGTGPVQGFATTLIIGILSSMFCAIFITRLVFDWMLKKDQAISFSTKATENVLRNKTFKFVENRRKFYLLSGAIIALGVVFAVKHGGFSLGVDFSGGRTYTVRFEEPVDRDAVRNELAKTLEVAPIVKTAGGDDQLKITTNVMAKEVTPESDSIVKSKIEAGIASAIGSDKFDIVSSVKVGPSIANTVIAKSFIVVAVSCLLMFLYILFRFRKWQFGLGAVAALVHDVLIVFSFYAIFDGILPFSLELDQHFVAAILTVMGYSMTDTVVVFDRIREFLAGAGKDTGVNNTSTINYALNSTLSRTINTSMITFFVLLAIFIFGGDTIRGFSFALLIGIVIGTYSSLCIATPIVVDFDKKNKAVANSNAKVTA
jgi:SecD/SecF fusion protein